MTEITSYLLNNGFLKCYIKSFTCIKKIHSIHSLFWEEELKHFSIGVYNETGKRGPAGIGDNYKTIVLPKPIYTIQEAENLINSISNG